MAGVRAVRRRLAVRRRREAVGVQPVVIASVAETEPAQVYFGDRTHGKRKSFGHVEKMRRVMEMRLSGMKFKDIGREIGLTAPAARGWLEKAERHFGFIDPNRISSPRLDE